MKPALRALPQKGPKGAQDSSRGLPTPSRCQQSTRPARCSKGYGSFCFSSVAQQPPDSPSSGDRATPAKSLINPVSARCGNLHQAHRSQANQQQREPQQTRVDSIETPENRPRQHRGSACRPISRAPHPNSFHPNPVRADRPNRSKTNQREDTRVAAGGQSSVELNTLSACQPRSATALQRRNEQCSPCRARSCAVSRPRLGWQRGA